MPHNEDQSKKEAYNQRTAKLLKYALKKLGRKVPKWVEKAAKDYHCKETRSKDELVKLIEPLSAQECHEIINVDSKKSIKLAEWWMAQSDKKREKDEEKAKESKKLVKSALKKLSQPERAALGF